MSADLPDYTRKVIVDQEIEGSTHLAVDVEQVKGQNLITPTIAKTLPVGIENENIRDATATPTVEHAFPVSVENPAIANATADPTVEHTVPVSVENPAIKNATKTPSVDNTVPISVENPALAYDQPNDEFYVRSKSTSRPIYADLRTLAGSPFSVANPLFVRIGDGTNNIPFPTALDTGALMIREQNKLTEIAVNNFPSDYPDSAVADLLALGIDITNFPTNYPDSDVATLLAAGLPQALDDGALKIREQGTPTIADITKTATPFWVQVVNSGTNVIIAAVEAKKHRLKALMVFNSGSAAITVDLRDGEGGGARFKATLAANSGWNFNLIGCNWELTTNTALYANLSGAGTVDVSGMYEDV